MAHPIYDPQPVRNYSPLSPRQKEAVAEYFQRFCPTAAYLRRSLVPISRFVDGEELWAPIEKDAVNVYFYDGDSLMVDVDPENLILTAREEGITLGLDDIKQVCLWRWSTCWAYEDKYWQAGKPKNLCDIVII